MQLEVNKSHKKIQFGPLRKALEKFSVGVLGTIMAISIYSGALTTPVYAAENAPTSIEWQIEDEKVEIPESISKKLEWELGKNSKDSLTKEDISQLKWFILELDDTVTSLDWLKHFNNLSSIDIFLQTNNLGVLDELSKSESLTNISLLTNTSDYYQVAPDNLAFIGNSQSIKSLSISENANLAPGCEKYLNQLEELNIMGGTNHDIDFSKLTNLKTLNLSLAKPYDIAIYLNSDEYNTLIKNGVNVKFSDEQAKNMYLNASRKLDTIVNDLDISENATEAEKLDAIMIYVLEHLEYDEQISKLLSENIDYEDLTKTFYENGMLYGALEKESAICGNYAALTEALMDRLNIPQSSYLLTSNTHAWNIVKIDGEPYYIDVTWLDGQTSNKTTAKETYADGSKTTTFTIESVTAEDTIRQGNGHELNWYRESIDSDHIASLDQKGSHKAVFVPEYMLESEAEDITNEDLAVSTAKDVTEKKVKVKIGTREIIIGAGALLGVLGGVGGTVIAIKKKKENERRRRMMYDSFYEDITSTPRDLDSFGRRY